MDPVVNQQLAELVLFKGNDAETEAVFSLTRRLIINRGVV